MYSRVGLFYQFIVGIVLFLSFVPEINHRFDIGLSPEESQNSQHALIEGRYIWYVDKKDDAEVEGCDIPQYQQDREIRMQSDRCCVSPVRLERSLDEEVWMYQLHPQDP